MFCEFPSVDWELFTKMTLNMGLPLLVFHLLAARKLKKRITGAPITAAQKLRQILPIGSIEHVALVYALVVMCFSFFPYANAIGSAYPELKQDFMATVGQHTRYAGFAQIGMVFAVFSFLSYAIKAGRIPVGTNLAAWVAVSIMLWLIIGMCPSGKDLVLMVPGVFGALSLDRIAWYQQQLYAKQRASKN